MSTTTTISNPYTKTILSRKLRLHITEVTGGPLKEQLYQTLVDQLANKCSEDGYVCPTSITVLQYSAGVVQEEYVVFHVVFSCFVAKPQEGQILQATIKTLTLAGVHAEVIDNHGNVPITVFVAHDTYRPIHGFERLQEHQKVLIKVVGTRFELNDPCVYVIAELQEKPSVDASDTTTTAYENQNNNLAGEEQEESMDIILN